MQSVNGKLVFEDGSVFTGRLLGKRNAVGEVVFTTGMCGYQETLTDPTCCDEIVVMTYPLIGNYGCSPIFDQSVGCHCQGLVVNELCEEPSNWRSEESLPAWLERHDVPVLMDVDTRALTRKIRREGTMKGVIVAEAASEEEVKSLLARPLKDDQVARVTTKEPYTVGNGKYKVAVLDLGVTKSVLSTLAGFDCTLEVMPAGSTPQDIMALRPDGLFLSNGPGNPEALQKEMETVQKLLGHLPIFGICLGHQLLALAQGLKTRKMAFGHRGANHPVKDIGLDKVFITTQNHGFVLDEAGIDGEQVEITHVSLNDNTIEGVRYKQYPAFGVQFCPDAPARGYAYLYENFVKLMGGR